MIQTVFGLWCALASTLLLWFRKTYSNHMRLNILSMFLLASFVFPQIVSADLIIPGRKYIPWCYEISNISAYPEYVFVFNERVVTGHQIINQGDCFNFYKMGITDIYAIKKTDFNENELNEEFFKENNPKLIKSDLQPRPFSPVQENDPLQKAVITLDITSLSKSSFSLQKSKVTYTYADGTSEEKAFQSQDVMPELSKAAVLPWWFAKFWYVALPVIAIALIGIILLARRLKKQV